MRLIPALLWIDSIAGLLVGVLTLSLSGWLSELYRLPMRLVLVMGGANLVYGTYSFFLARQPARPRARIGFLVVANGLWGVLCAATAVVVFRSASFFGLAHLIAEALFVAGLATLEWRHRERLRKAF